MFPWNYGFAWDAGHIIFLGVFYAVVLVVLTTLLVAAWRTLRAYRRKHAIYIAWHQYFADLPRAERTCRHAFTGEMPGRVCELDFNCGKCEQHGKFIILQAECGAAPQLMLGVVDDSLGLPLPLDRYYHRGHTWVKLEPGGVCTIGLDELARRVVANPESVELPAVGSKLSTHGTGWTMHVRGADVHIMSPVEGEVLETALSGKEWFLRVKPAQNTSFAHLLRGTEVSSWMTSELGRVEKMISESVHKPALSKGGAPVDDFAAACPQADWRSIRGAVFLTN